MKYTMKIIKAELFYFLGTCLTAFVAAIDAILRTVNQRRSDRSLAVCQVIPNSIDPTSATIRDIRKHLLELVEQAVPTMPGMKTVREELQFADPHDWKVATDSAISILRIVEQRMRSLWRQGHILNGADDLVIALRTAGPVPISIITVHTNRASISFVTDPMMSRIFGGFAVKDVIF